MTKYLVLLILCISLFSCKDDASNIPAAIKADFEKKFSGAMDVEWEIEEDGYEAEFEKDGVEMSANYDLNNAWTETEATINEKDLPAALKAGIQRSYPEYRIEKAESIRTPLMSGYEIHLENDNEEVEVVVNKRGDIVKVKDDEKD